MGLRARLLMPALLPVLLAALYLGGTSFAIATGFGRLPPAVFAMLLGAGAVLLPLALSFEILVRRPLGKLVSAFQALLPNALPESGRPRDEIGALEACLLAMQQALQRQESDLHHARLQRERAETELRESEERYALAIRAANDGLWEWNLKSGEAYFSPRWKSMLGYEEPDIAGTFDEWRQRLHPDDRAEALEKLDAHLAGQTPGFENEHRLRGRDGQWRWVLTRAAAIRHASGRPYRMVGLDTDITRIKRTSEILLHVAEGTSVSVREDFFRSLVRHFAAALQVRYCFITTCVDVPTTRVRMLAYWSGHDFADNIEFDLAGTPCEHVIQEGKVYYCPRDVAVRYPRERGRESYLGIPICNPAGQVIGHLAFFGEQPMTDDVLLPAVYKIFAAQAATEMQRMWAEDALGSARQRAQVALASISEAVLGSDAQGCIDFLNPVAERLTGYTQTEACGQPVADVFRLRAALAGDSGPAGHMEAAQLLRRDGTSLPIHYSQAPLLTRSGQGAGAVVVFRPGGADGGSRVAATQAGGR